MGNKSIVDLFIEEYGRDVRKVQAEESPTDKSKKKKTRVKEKEFESEFKIPGVEFKEPTTEPLAKVKEEEKEQKKEKKEPGRQRELVFGPAPDIKKAPDFIVEVREGEEPTEEIVPVKTPEEITLKKTKKKDEIERYRRDLPSKEFERHIVPPIKYKEEVPPPFGLIETKDKGEFLSKMEEVWNYLERLGVSKEEIEKMRKKYEETGELSFTVASSKIPFGGGMFGLMVSTEGKTPEEVWKEIEKLLRASRVSEHTLKSVKKEFMSSGEAKVTSFPLSEIPMFRKRLPKRGK